MKWVVIPGTCDTDTKTNSPSSRFGSFGINAGLDLGFNLGFTASGLGSGNSGSSGSLNNGQNCIQQYVSNPRWVK